MGPASTGADSGADDTPDGVNVGSGRAGGQIPEPLSGWLRARPGLPVTGLGFAYVVFGIVHVLGIPDPMLIDAVTVSVLEILGLAIVYGGQRATERGLPVNDAVWTFGVTLMIGFIGFVVAAVLIILQLQRGVPIEEEAFLMITASATTAAIGVAVALYHHDLRAERDQVSAQAETLKELNKRLTVLHRVLRHNLRNEVTVLRGHADYLLTQDPPADAAASLRTIVEHANRVEELSQNAYRLRQVWNETVTVDQEVTELVEVAARAVEAAHPGVAIQTELPSKAVAQAHPRLQLAVREALENAIVHNEPESLEIVAAIDWSDDDDRGVEITIADTGRGIPDLEPAVLEQVGEGALSHGTGLGLWLIYWVVELSGGALAFEDNDPQGTIVRMRLPAANR